MKRILLIEDTKDVLDYLIDVLDTEGYICKGFGLGQDAIDCAKEFNPHLIICDIILPDIDGYSIFREIKKIPELVNVPFVYLTALARKEDRDKGMQLGADDYLIKPISPMTLLSAVEFRLKK